MENGAKNFIFDIKIEFRHMSPAKKNNNKKKRTIEHEYIVIFTYAVQTILMNNAE